MKRTDLNTRSLMDVSPVLPADGEALIFDSAAGLYVPGAGVGATGPAGPAGTPGADGASGVGEPDPTHPPSSELLVSGSPVNLLEVAVTTANTNLTATAGQTYFMPFKVGWSCTITQLWAHRATSTAGSTCEIGIYDSDGTNGLPSTRLAVITGLALSGSADTSVSGTLGTPVTLEPGRLYWAAMAISSGSNPSVRAHVAASLLRPCRWDPGNASKATHLLVAQNTLPDPTATPTAFGSGNVPFVGCVTSNAPGAGGAGTGEVGFSAANEFDRANILALSKELSYDVDGNLVQILLYDDAPPTNLIYTKDFTYDVDGNLDTIELTRDSDSAVFTKTFAYDVDGNLESTEIA